MRVPNLRLESSGVFITININFHKIEKITTKNITIIQLLNFLLL